MYVRFISFLTLLFFLLPFQTLTVYSVPLMNDKGEEVNLFEIQSVKKIDATASCYSPDEENELNNALIDSNEGLLRVGSFNIESHNNIIDTSYLILPSTVSENFINNRLKGTDLEGLGKAFKDAEEKYGVNALFLVSLAMHESNVGKSKIAQMKNNIFGFQAYDRAPFDYSRRFSSKEECIDYVAEYVAKNYLSPNGKYFNGYSIESMNIYYATDINWSRGIKYRLDQLLLTY